MLINVRASLDKIEGFENESFQPEEIQLYLNKSQFRLLDDLINKNFQQGSLRYEWIRPFQSSTQIGVTWLVGENFTAVSFPGNMYYLVSALAGVTVSSANYSSGGTSKDCLDIISDPQSIANPHSVTEQLDIIETGKVSDQETNAFYGENYRNPRGELIGQGVRLWRGEKFIINSVTFDYISSPTNIDVSSSTATVWPVSANEKIVDYTVEYMRLTIQDPAYQANVNDFNIRTQNA